MMQRYRVLSQAGRVAADAARFACRSPKAKNSTLWSYPKQLPSGRPADLISTRLRLPLTGTSGAPLLCFVRRPRVPNAPTPVLPAAWVSQRGITSDADNAPLPASAGRVFFLPHLNALNLRLPRLGSLIQREWYPLGQVRSPIQAESRALWRRCQRTMPSGTGVWRSCAWSQRPTGERPTSRIATRCSRSSGCGARIRRAPVLPRTTVD